MARHGVTDRQWLHADQAHALEPEVSVVASLLSLSTDTVDNNGLMLALQGDFEGSGGALAGSRRSRRSLSRGHSTSCV